MRIVTASALAALLMSLAASDARAVTYVVNFAGAGGLNPAGTITFAATNDLFPSAFGFSDSTGAIWTPTDFQSPAVTGHWTGGSLLAITGTILDTTLPGLGSGSVLAFTNLGQWTSSVASGAYTLTAVPEPSTAVLVALGGLVLGLRTRRAAAGSRQRCSQRIEGSPGPR